MTKRLLVSPLLALLLLLTPLTASAAPIRVFVSEFAASTPDAAQLKATVRTLFTSRIAGDDVVIVGTPVEAEVVCEGTYTQLGKSFSIDAVAKLKSGKILATAFEQGDSQDALIPAIGKVAGKIRSEAIKGVVPAATALPPAPLQSASRQPTTENGPSLLSQRLGGTLRSLAIGGSSAGGREIFVVDENSIRLYRQGKQLTLLAEVKVSLREKVLSVDSLGADQNGKLRAYVTILDGDAPSSRIYTFENGTLKLEAKNLPYLFRAIALYGEKAKIYVQQMGRVDDFYGDVYELAEGAAGFELKNPFKLPNHANIYTFNKTRDQAGKSYFVVLTESGYLVVYGENGEELYRSGDKFGGSETFFQREAGANVRVTGESLTTRFLEQRITVTDKGDIIVPQNSGFLVFGNIRSYANYTICFFTWNGVNLDERWRSKKVNNYLADYAWEPKSGQLVLLEVVQHDGAFSKGGSAVRVISAN